ncbi:MAG: aminotransferase class V-fold PLP-dependent enzyme [Betaproteobacteria bacterium]|nr:aminotransferase class V-fold PLP-dependent enzyme [Betaproteobacteria bacterium]
MDVPLFKVHMPGEVHPALRETFASGYIAQGEKVAAFETELRRLLGTDHVVSVSDCSAAITLALFIAGVRPGDEVIASPMCCLATNMPIANLFARPVWCDVDPATGMLDPGRIAQAVTPRTRAVLAFHWSGDVADLGALRAAAHAHGLKLIADASEAFGARWLGRPLGAADADFTVYSFGAVRHITCGDGAALLAAGAEDHAAAERLRRYGIDRSSFRLPSGDINSASDIALAGYYFPMNNIEAAIGLAQLPHAEAIVARHQANGRFFEAALAGVAGITRLARRADAQSAYWTYSLRAERRADLLRKLRAAGIGAQRLHLRNDLYTCFAASTGGALAGVETFDAENLAIPCGWWLSDADRERIAGIIRSGW